MERQPPTKLRYNNERKTFFVVAIHPKWTF